MKQIMFLFVVAMLILASTVAAQEEHEIEDSGAIAVGASVTGEFETGVRDRYTVEVGDTPVLNIFLDGAPDMDTYLFVYRKGEDEPFVENDDRGDGTLYSAVEGIEVEAGETLIIEATTYADEGAGEYRLRVSPPATIEDAGEIAIGDNVEGTFPENTRQRYTLTLDETTALHIAVEGADDLDTYLRIYREGEDSPTLQSDSIEAENLTAGFNGLVVPGGTTLVLEAATYGDAGAGDYTLVVEESDLAMPTTETPIELTEDTELADLCADAESTEDPPRLQYFAADDALEADVDYGAVFCTEAGNFHVDLYEAEAPITVNSFVFLANNHFFDNLTFHRVIEDFVVQGGDPTGTGSGGPGYEFVNETDNELSFGGIGVLGMANAGPDTNGSQFFITLAPVARLTGGYTIFGQVMAGMKSVFDIEERDPATATDPGTQIYRVIIVTQPPAEE